MTSSESFICPITQVKMIDPVMDPEGHSYERKAIMEWLKRNKTSPVTRSPLDSTTLSPNRALKQAIQEASGDFIKQLSKEDEEKLLLSIEGVQYKDNTLI